MALNRKVGNSVSEFLQDMSEYELSCPICFEEFKEPKSLPNCAHSVCLDCLEKMSANTSTIFKFECPVCRIESPLPSDGVKAWPTNSRIVRLMDRFPGRQDKLAIKTASQRCREACDATSKREEEYKMSSKRVKTEVEDKAQKLVEFIRDQERTLLDKIDQVVKDELSRKPELRSQGTKLVENADVIIERGDVYEIVEAKESLVSQLDQITRELQPESGSFMDLLRGKLQEHQESSVLTTKAQTNNNVVHFDPKYNKIITKTIEPDKFLPFDIATTSCSKLVVLDSRFRTVSIFDEDGCVGNQFRVGFHDLWGMTILPNTNEIVIICNDSSDDNGITGHLLHYDINGNFIKKQTVEELKNVFLTGITFDSTNKMFIITSGIFPDTKKGEKTRGGLIVLSEKIELKLSTLDSGKQNLRKAVYFQEKYYCTQINKPGTEACIQVLNKAGILLNEFGNAELHDPHGLVVDQEKSMILVCERQLNSIVVFDLEGTFLSLVNTKNDPVQVAMSTINNDVIVACYLGVCVQVICYEWFSGLFGKFAQQRKLDTK